MKGTGAELHRPLAVVYIGGFFFAVLLRLFVVPVLYDSFARAAEWFHSTGRNKGSITT
jgi:Cu/Ag efflux pump CusA